MNRKLPAPRAAIQAIALNTFREAIRDKVLYLLLVIALLAIATGRLLALLTVGSEDKIMKDVGLGSISIFSLLIAIFMGVSLVVKEIDKRTIYTLLANPVHRWQFIVGKYLGLLTVLALLVGSMSILFFLVLALRGVSPWPLVPALLLIYVEVAIITSVALLFSCVTNPLLASVWTMLCFILGRSTWSLQMLGESLGGFGQMSCKILYRILPNLDRLNISSEVVHNVALAPGFVWQSALYGLGHSILILALACLAFERKDFL